FCQSVICRDYPSKPAFPALAASSGAFFAAHVLEYISALDARKLATLANGHGPLGRLQVGFRAKSAIFLASVEKSCFSRCDAGALAVGELVSRTDKDSTASYG
ncbi:hypothetical protein, partial [Desulfovibrio porci]|uniref:hypothetical protein n=1 Tax=Desulfovibrio porci TaxID=2605782 RepID=UPI002A822751